MPLLTTYAFQDSLIHRLDPRTKITWLAVILVLAFATNQVILLSAYLALVLALSILAKLDLRSFWPMIKILVTLTVGVFVLQTVFQGEGDIFLSIGPVNFYTEGAWLTLEVMLRLFVMILLFLQFLMWTHPTDLTLMWIKMGLPYKYAMLTSLALRFFPVLEQEMVKIFEAQQARGLELSGSIRKALGLVPISLPFCLRAFRRTNEVALSMELKGYGYRRSRTFLREIGFRLADYIIIAALAAILLAYFLAAYYVRVV